ncbi:MAG: tRNA (cytidine(34)-2'-O)-methyltransferase [Gammaproteobacteria bacterium]|nr:MAG: tRNA (cytidine(34)-2'-O)-methyltransferase [Gammaproteobacteria bacterium]
MFEVVLHEPEIPPNTGNIMRLCANTGCRLHLIEPLGFTLDDARLRRAGLDYREYVGVDVHKDLAACLTALGATLDTQATGPGPLDATLDSQEMDREARLGVQSQRGAGPRLFAFSTRGTRRHDQVIWQSGDIMLFGAETRGLPASILEQVPTDQRLRLPMRPESRSLNLGNAVAVAIYEAWRQQDFVGSS